jgi:hypothetical protein
LAAVQRTHDGACDSRACVWDRRTSEDHAAVRGGWNKTVVTSVESWELAEEGIGEVRLSKR